jgi:Short C-terminal domain
MQDPVRGTAQVVSASMNRGRGILQMCRMQLVIQAEGIPPTAVSFNGLVHYDRWPAPGMVLPVTVDRAEPQRISIDWDEVPSRAERSQQSAEGLAAMLRGEGGGAAAGSTGGPMIVNVSGRDLSQLSEEQKAKLRMFGIDPDALAASQTPAGPVPPPPPTEEAAMDERLGRLERLAKLKEQGVLTEEEFEEQKARILES